MKESTELPSSALPLTFPVVVRDVLAITSGDLSDGNVVKSWSLIMSGGEECLDHDLPDNPVQLEGVGVAQAFDRFIYLCGGVDASSCNLFF